MPNGQLDPLTHLPERQKQPDLLDLRNQMLTTQGVSLPELIGERPAGLTLEEQRELGTFPAPTTREEAEYILGETQPVSEKLLHGLGRTGGKFLTEVGKMPGMTAGALGAMGTGDIKTIVDNSWINYFEQLDEEIKESLPVYVKERVAKGNLWNNISSPEFWATDGADAIGFLTSMLVPGSVLKLTGMGARIGRAMGAGISGSEKIDNWSQAVLNTLFESGAEAGGVVDNLKAELGEKVKRGELSQQEANRIIGEAGRDTFLSNFGILLGPNILTVKYLNNLISKPRTIASHITDPKTGLLLSQLPKEAFGEPFKQAGKNLLKGAAVEGFWEEGTQFAVEDYFHKKAVAEAEHTDYNKDIFDSYLDALNTTEGQKGIFLGALLGGVLGGIGGYAESKKLASEGNRVLKLLNEAKDEFTGVATSLYKKNEDGTLFIDPKKKKPVYDTKSILSNLLNVSDDLIEDQALNEAAAKGNGEAISFLLNEKFTKAAIAFSQIDGGVEIFGKHLDKSLDEIATLYSTLRGETVNKEDVKNSLITKAKSINEQISNLNNYSARYFNIKTENKRDEKKIAPFIEKVKRASVTAHSRQLFYNERINNLRERIDSLIKEDTAVSKKTASVLEKQLSEYEKALSKSKEETVDLFNRDKLQEAFDKYLGIERKIEETIAALDNQIKNTETDKTFASEKIKDLFKDNTSTEKLSYAGKEHELLHSAVLSFNTVEEFKDDKGVDLTNEFEIKSISSEGNLILENSKDKRSAVYTKDNQLKYAGKTYNVKDTTTRLSIAENIRNKKIQAKKFALNSLLEVRRYDLTKATKKIQDVEEQILNTLIEIEEQGKVLKTLDGRTRKAKEIKALIKDLEVEVEILNETIDGLKQEKAKVEDVINEIRRDLDRTSRLEDFDIKKKLAEAEDYVILSEYKNLEELEKLSSDTDDVLRELEEKRNRLRVYIDVLNSVVTNNEALKTFIQRYPNAPTDYGQLTRFIQQEEVFRRQYPDFSRYVDENPDIFTDLGKIVREKNNAEFVDNELLISNKELVKLNDLINEYKKLSEEYKKEKGIYKRSEYIINEYKNLTGYALKEYIKLSEKSSEVIKDKDLAIGKEKIFDEADIDSNIEKAATKDRDEEKDPKPDFVSHVSFLRTTGNQKDAADKPHVKRWFDFVEAYNVSTKKKNEVITLVSYTVRNIPDELKNKVKFYIPSLNKELTVAEIGNKEDLLKEAESDIKLIATYDKSGEYYRADGEVVYTSMALPTKILPSQQDRFNYDKRIGEIKKKKRVTDEEANELFNAEYEEAVKKHVELRKKASESNLKFTIESKNTGYKVPGKYGSPLSRLYNKISEIKSLDIFVATRKTLSSQGKTFTMMLGMPYVMVNNNKPEVLWQKKLSDIDGLTDRVVRLLQYYGKTEDEGEKRIVKTHLESITVFGYTKKKDSSYRLAVMKNGDILYGSKRISKDELLKDENKIKDFKRFLDNKYHHVNKLLVEKEGVYKVYDIKDGKRITVDTFTVNNGGYKGYLLHDTKTNQSKLKTNLAVKGDSTVPQYLNSSFTYTSSDVTVESKPKTGVVKKKTKSSGKKLQVTDIPSLEDGTIFHFTRVTPKGTYKINYKKEGDRIVPINIYQNNKEIEHVSLGQLSELYTKAIEKDAFDEFGPGAGITSVEPGKYKPVEKKTESEIDPDDKYTEEETDDIDSLVKEIQEKTGRSADEVSKLLKEDNEDEESPFRLVSVAKGEKPIKLSEEIKWFKERFPDIPIEVVAGLIQGKAYGRFLKEVKVLISELATEGTVYHEAFHVVSQAFFTESERKKLYDEVRDRLRNQTVTTFKGEEKKAQFLTDLETEEFLAEEFRDYILSDGSYKFDESKQIVQKNLFQRLLAFIKNFFNNLRGRKNESPYTIEEVFKTIEAGKYSIKDVRGKPIADLDRIGSLTEAHSTAILKNINYKFFKILFKNPGNTLGAKALFHIDTKFKDIYDRILLDYYKEAASKGRRPIEIKLWDDIKKEHIKFLRQFRIEVGTEVEEDQRETRDNVAYLESNRVSSKDSVPQPVRLLIAGIPVVYYDENGIIKTKKFSDYNTYATIRYNNMMNLLHNILADKTSYVDMVTELKERAADHPEFEVLLRWLGSWDRPTNESVDRYQLMLQNQFYTHFSKTKLNPVVYIIKDNGEIVPVDAVSQNLTSIIIERWKQEGKLLSFKEDSYFKRDGRGNVIFDIDKKIPLSYGKVSFKDVEAKKLSFEDKVAILEVLGIKFNVPYTALSDRDTISDAVSIFISNIKTSVKADDIFSRDAVKANKEIKALAEYAALFLDDDIEHQYFNQEGNREYNLGLNNHLSKVTSLLNSNEIPSYLVKYDRDTNETGNIFTVGSQWLNLLDRYNIQHILLRGTKTEFESGDDIASLTYADYLYTTFNAVLNGQFPYLRSGDAKLEYGFVFLDKNTGKPRKTDTTVSETNFVDLFRDNYLVDEVATVLANYTDEVGDNLYNYSKSVKSLRFFKDILPGLNLDILKTYPSDNVYSRGGYTTVARDFVDKNSDYINKQLSKYFKEAVARNKEVLSDYNLIKDKGKEISFFGIAKNNVKSILGKEIGDTITPEELNRILEVFTYYYLQSAVEQTKLFTGDIGMYKSVVEFHKRTKGNTSTKNDSRTDDYNQQSLNTLYKRADGKTVDRDTIYEVVYNDVIVKSSEYVNYKKLIGNELSSLYKGNIKESDAQSRATLDEYRELQLNRGQWDDEAEKTYQYEMQLFMKKLIGNPLFREGDFKEEDYIDLFKEHIGNSIPAEPMFEGIIINKYTLKPIPPQKPMGFGSISNVVGVFAPNYSKMSLSPIIPSLYKDNSPMMGLLIDMMNNQVGMISFESGKKGEILAKKGKLPPFYQKDGSITRIDTDLIQHLPYADIGVQQEIDPSGKERVTLSTQKERLEPINSFDLGEPINDEFASLISEKNRLKNEISRRNREYVIKRLGLTERKGKFTLTNPDLFRKTLIEAFEKRQLPTNITEGLDLVLSSPYKIFDTLITKNQLENVLNAIIRKNAISLKSRGDMLIQESSTGNEISKRETDISNYLKFYQQETPNSKIIEMEVEIALPGEWYKWVDRTFGSLDAFNDAIAKGKIDKRLITYVANRIPAQGMNSLEVVKVKRFLPPHVGSKIVLPSEIVTKAGSDFDIDKLFTYFTNYTMTSDGPKYIRYSTAEGNLTERYYNKIREELRNLDISESFDRDETSVIAKKHGLISLKEFGSLSVEEQNTIEAIENRSVEIAKEFILAPENFPQLIAPLTSKRLKDLSSEIAEEKDVNNYHYLHEWWFNSHIARRNWAGIAGRGQSALTIASHATTQQTPLIIQDELVEIYFENQERSKGEYRLGHIFDSSDSWISSNFAEFMSAYVDSAKDPFIGKLNAGVSVFPAYAFLNRTSNSSPVDIKTLAYFFTQPIILEYIKLQDSNRSNFLQIAKQRVRNENLIRRIINKYSTRDASLTFDDMLSTTYDKYTSETNPEMKQLLKEKYNELKSKSGYKYLNLETLKGLKSATKDKAYYETQLQIFDNFLTYQKYGSKLTEVQRLTRPDAYFPKTRAELKVRNRSYINILNEGFFTRDSILSLTRDTMLKEMMKTHQISSDIFAEFFLSDRLPDVTNFYFNIIDEYRNRFLKDQEIYDFMQAMENDFTTFILHVIPDSENSRLNELYERLFKGKNSIAVRLNTLRDKYPDNDVFKELQPIIDEFVQRRGRSSGINNVKLFTKRFRVEELNSLVTSFKELFESDEKDVREFATDLAKFSILQSGYTASPIFFNNVVPEEHLQPILNDIVTNFIKTYSKGNRLPDLLSRFKDQFFRNNWSDRSIVPRANIYSKSVSLATNRSSLKIMSRNSLSQYEYVSVEVPSVNYTTERKLREENKIVPKEVYLFRRYLTSDDHVLYERISKLGDSFRMKEFYNTDQPSSIIPYNNIEYGKSTVGIRKAEDRKETEEPPIEDYSYDDYQEMGDIEDLYQLTKPKEVEYEFKLDRRITDNIQRIESLYKQIKDKEVFWSKIQKDFQIPKEQIELLKSQEGETIGQKLTNFLANYSYTVEISTAKEKGIEHKEGLTKYKVNYKGVFERGEFDSKQEALNYINSEVERGKNEDDYRIEGNLYSYENRPTQHYSYLTVPGGTNYTENEIATQAITPSIKGHAQFSTDKGIGWFRSDDKVVEGTEAISTKGKIIGEGEMEFFEPDEYEKPLITNTGESSKTRRILEVQDDWLQKLKLNFRINGINYSKGTLNEKNGRYYLQIYNFNKKERKQDSITKTISKEKYDRLKEKSKNNIVWLKGEIGEEQAISTNEYFKAYDEFIDKGDILAEGYTEQQRQFAKLLANEEYGWNFRIKSIIQDSAKKGYEKVLFPTGNTASKIEGHDTLEEFKKQKEDRLQMLEKRRKKLTLTSNMWKVTEVGNDSTKVWFDTEEQAKEWIKKEEAKDTSRMFHSPLFSGADYTRDAKELKDTNNEINQLKQELERVEREGFGALKPIYKFYENTVTNILKKQGYSPKLITDEYGNTWNEIEIKPEHREEKILLQRKEVKEISSEILDERIKTLLKSMGVDYRAVSQIRNNKGEIIDAVAVARLANMTVEVIEGKRDITTLPEEASHFFVALLPESNPLKKAMFNNITNYSIYDEVVNDYSEIYKNNESRLKEEAIGKLIAQYIVAYHKGEKFEAELSPRQKTQVTNWIKALMNFIKRLFGKINTDPFVKSAYKMMNSDLSDLNAFVTAKEELLAFRPLRGEERYRETMRRKKLVGDMLHMKIMTPEEVTEVIKEHTIIQMNKVTSTFYDELADARTEIFTNFNKYYPNYDYFTDEEKKEFVKALTQGELEAYCF